MMSIGIRFGQGFDKTTVGKLLPETKKFYDFRVLILGSNPGGICCAKEAINNNMKTALVYWRMPTEAEKDIQDECKEQMMHSLEITHEGLVKRIGKRLAENNKTNLMDVIKVPKPCKNKVSQTISHGKTKVVKWSKKIRSSNLDLNNAVVNMAEEGLISMHNISVVNDFSIRKRKIPVSWGRMMETVFDDTIRKNWDLLTDLLMLKISLYKGYPSFIDEHTIAIIGEDGERTVISAENIVSAVECHCSLPNIPGAKEYGITFDDFYRLSLSPGKTLVVGDNTHILECAGILTSFQFPVDVIYPSDFFIEADEDILEMIKSDLIKKGVNFLDHTSLVSIKKDSEKNKLVAQLITKVPKTNPTTTNVEYDTILFTNYEKPSDMISNVALQNEIEKLFEKEMSPENKAMLRDVIVIPDMKDDIAATRRMGRDIGRKLFTKDTSDDKYPAEPAWCDEYEMKESEYDDKIVPRGLFTPLEYAYYGVSEKLAIERLGETCVNVSSGFFKSQDIISEKTTDDQICFAKIISVPYKDLIVGLHLFGRDALLIMKTVLHDIRKRILVSNLHPSIGTLITNAEEDLEE